jgi:hypothetical protein
MGILYVCDRCGETTSGHPPFIYAKFEHQDNRRGTPFLEIERLYCSDCFEGVKSVIREEMEKAGTFIESVKRAVKRKTKKK